jgi:quercetin dioxygenase-like cupin family protein
MADSITKVIDLVPGDVIPLETVRADALDERTFWDRYVCRHAPLLIRGAVAHWPALERWSQPNYLETRCGDVETDVFGTFNPNPHLDSAAKRRVRLADGIAEIRSAADDRTLSMPAFDLPSAWQADLARYHFLVEHDRAPLAYPGKRVFFYKNASTEWHYHQLDETLTCQLAGSKRVSLFRLSSAHWYRVAPLIRANYHHMSCASRFFPTEIRLTKHEGVIEPGDAVYLPPFWWHGIDAATSEPGITLAQCFRSPLRRIGAWSDPATRELAADALRTSKLRFLPLMALIAMSSASRAIHKEAWSPP